MEQFELHLRGEPSKHRELDAPLLSREVTARLGQRADGPLEIADDLPVAERGERDVPTRERVVPLEIRLDLADAAQMELIDAEAPRPYERPRDVFGRVATVPELPIEHVAEAHRGDREIAETQVAVEYDCFALLRRLPCRPGTTELDRRLRVAEAVDLVREPPQHAACDAAAGAPHQELALSLRRAQVQRPCLLRRSAREEGESLDRDVRAEERDEALAQLELDGQRRPRRPSDAHNAVCPPSTARICPVM